MLCMLCNARWDLTAGGLGKLANQVCAVPA